VLRVNSSNVPDPSRSATFDEGSSASTAGGPFPFMLVGVAFLLLYRLVRNSS
jgi:hypothetical protein